MNKILDYINGAILAVLFILVVITVICRLILSIAVPWTEMLIQACFVLIAFVGAASLMKDESHISITTLTTRLGLIPQKVCLCVARLFVLWFLVIFALGAWETTIINWNVMLPTSTWMKIGYVYLVMLLSSLCMIFYTGVNFFNEFRKNKKTSAKQAGSMI